VSGARLLRDRATLVPERALQRHVWRPSGTPAVVLLDGRAVATWRQEARSRQLTATVEPFAGLDEDARAQVEVEAAELARFRGAAAAAVVVAPARVGA
jgi:hypothetical protein